MLDQRGLADLTRAQYETDLGAGQDLCEQGFGGSLDRLVLQNDL
ncbi:MAG: hypothetical protein N838_18545 [Thiohalocapsa sp. PB-PSB1]|jgi:hypothetical protein|nr:MAG: hypothetical protein N838_18545 [Thiohalocapsa sp. PB-PSB1]